MAAGIVGANRRIAERVSPEHTQWQSLALLRPGQEVVLVNVSTGGALVESPTRLAPGARTELQLFGRSRCSVRGRLERCRVSRLEPLRYEGVIVFDACLELPEPDAPGRSFPSSGAGSCAGESVTRPPQALAAANGGIRADWWR